MKTKEFPERLQVLKPEHIRIRVVTCEKRTQTDSWEHGCNPDTSKSKELFLTPSIYSNVVDAFRQLVGDSRIKAEEIGTIDPNIYRDRKGGGQPITVENNTEAGKFRCTYSREENSHGRKPTAKEREEFEAGKIDLKLADYEIYFHVHVQIVGVEEADLADLLGVNNW